MLRPIPSWRQLSALAIILGVSACSETSSRPVASNPPPVPPGPGATWYHMYFDSNSFALTQDDRKVAGELATFLKNHPAAVATIIG